LPRPADPPKAIAGLTVSDIEAAHDGEWNDGFNCAGTHVSDIEHAS
jgi:hypothetical protein